LGGHLDLFCNGPPKPDQSTFCALGIEKSNPFRLLGELMIRVYSGGIAATNSYALPLEKGTILVDAPEGVVEWLQQEGLRPDALFLTHQHFDHVWDAALVAQTFGCPVYAWSSYSKDLTLEKLFALQSGGGLSIPAFSVSEALQDRETVQIAGIEWSLYHVPGHSPDSLCLHDPQAGWLFGGDVLFAGGVGRTDFPGGDMSGLIQGIEQKLLILPDDTKVFPGHGGPTSIGEERESNPFL